MWINNLRKTIPMLTTKTYSLLDYHYDLKMMMDSLVTLVYLYENFCARS